MHEIHCPELSEEIVSSLDNAALWAYKVGKEALNQADLFSNQQCLEQMGLIVGVSSAGTEAFLPLLNSVLMISRYVKLFSQAAFLHVVPALLRFWDLKVEWNSSQRLVRRVRMLSAWLLIISRMAKARRC